MSLTATREDLVLRQTVKINRGNLDLVAAQLGWSYSQVIDHLANKRNRGWWRSAKKHFSKLRARKSASMTRSRRIRRGIDPDLQRLMEKDKIP